MPRRNPTSKHSQVPKPNAHNQKRRYASEREALEAKEIQELTFMNLSLEVYRCLKPGCNGWHLTSRKHPEN